MNTYEIEYTNIVNRYVGYKRVVAFDETRAKLIFESKFKDYLIDNIELILIH